MAGRALWIMLLLLCPLVGFSFVQAVCALCRRQSIGAAIAGARDQPVAVRRHARSRLWAASMSASRCCFRSLRSARSEARRKRAHCGCSFSCPIGSATLVTAKLVAIASAWLLCAIPALSALAIWTLLGGHLGAAETLNLLVGQLLYGLLIGAIALFAAAIADSSATAAIITLAFTIGSWVLDFTFAGNPGLLGWISRLSLTQTLRTFEQGLLSIGLIVGMLAVVCGFAALAAVWLPPGSADPHEASALGDLHRSGSTCCCRGRADPPVRRRDGGPAQFLPPRRCAGARKPHGTADRDRSPGAGRPPLCRPQSQRARQA